MPRAEGVGTGGRSPARVVDLGAGTGTGAVGLALRLPRAEVVAVDVSADSLARVATKAQAAGVADRVRTLVADLDAGWPDLAPIDVTWASMSLHHLADPVRSLAQLRRMTRPGGLLAVSEFDEPLRFLPEDLGVGRPGLESRTLEALSTVHAEALPNIGASWAAMLDEAGGPSSTSTTSSSTSARRATRSPAVMRAPGSPGSRAGSTVASTSTTSARSRSCSTTAPRGLLHRSDLHLHGIRTLTLARP